ncbi:HDIG domain-containing protein [Marinococcus luteus]|uniref:HDIG domain-containing protein n=1 Tax=Marinococcus luteus TaxID=1122204 RepID=A0A1H2QVG5_9BACI|nr:HD domain-containing phosphohydrolase [Marinococcus luteus]SDW11131.1 HDIG domain-containing protein [Marinococcus luteus]
MPISPEDRRLFLKNTSGLDNSFRLGGKLQQPAYYHWLEHLFHSLLKDKAVRQLFQQLAAWDMYTYRHSFDVFLLGSLVAQQLEWPNIREIACGLLLHDIGKTAIPRTVLTKQKTPTLAEWKMLKSHAKQGYSILKDRGFSEFISSMAYRHHERMDGSGYPNGAPASKLEDPVRLLSVLDVYSALSLDRPYLRAVSPLQAVHLLRKEAGPLEPEYIRVFCEFLGIFPTGATVQLTSGATAVIADIDEDLPTLPLVRDIQTHEAFYLPVDQTVRISQWIDPL